MNCKQKAGVPILSGSGGVCLWSMHRVVGLGGWLLGVAAWGQGSDLSIPNYNGPGAATGSGIEVRDPSGGERVDAGVSRDLALSRDLPYVPPLSAPRRDYNVKMGDVTMRFSSGLALTYTDNALLAGSGQARREDFAVTPSMNFDIDLPISPTQSFRINMGVGYRYHFNVSEFNGLYFSPSSVIDYRFKVGDVIVTLYDRVSSTADTLRRFDLRTTGTTGGVDFNRIGNTAGLSADYSMSRDTSLVGGYSYTIDRGLQDAFSFNNSDTHSLHAAMYHRLHPRLTIGLASSYNIQEFNDVRNQLSGSTGWSVGPNVSYRPNQFINLSASVRYTSFTYEDIGGFQAANNPQTFTFDLSARHQINRELSHQLSAGRSFQNSLAAAQMEVYSVGYGVTWQFLRHMALMANVNWQNFSQSGNVLSRAFPSRAAAIEQLTGLPQRDGSTLTAAQAAALYDFYSYQDSGDGINLSVGTSYQLTRKLNISLSYAHTLRSSNVKGTQGGPIGPSFNANTASLLFNYRF